MIEEFYDITTPQASEAYSAKELNAKMAWGDACLPGAMTPEAPLQNIPRESAIPAQPTTSITTGLDPSKLHSRVVRKMMIMSRDSSAAYHLH